MATETWERWLRTLIEFAEPSEDEWVRRVVWEEPRTAAVGYPPDFRATLDIFDVRTIEGGPGFRGGIRLVSPADEDHEAERGDGTPGTPHADLRLAGVSRGAGEPWRSMPVPGPGTAERAWGDLFDERSRVETEIRWGPARPDGSRGTFLASARRHEVWFLAMSVPEILVRLVTGTTGCPWLSLGSPTLLPVAKTLCRWPGEETPEDVPNPSGSWGRGTIFVPARSIPRPIAPPAVEKGGEPSLPRAFGLRSLRKRYAPPDTPVGERDRTAAVAVYGAPLPVSLVSLLELYGAGVFGGPEDEDDDEWRPTVELLSPDRCAAFTTSVRETLHLVDATDLLRGRSPEQLGVLQFAVLGDQGDALWCWRLGDEAGVAMWDEMSMAALRVGGDAAAVVAAALSAHGVLGDAFDGPEITHHFRPGAEIL